MKYVKKSSIQEVVDVAKTQAGVASSTKVTLPQGVVDTIGAIEVVESKGSPSVLLHKSSKTYPLEKGRYTGGTVTVNPEEKTVTPSTAQQSITASANRALKKVTVNPMPLYKVQTGQFNATSKKSTWSVTGLQFRPEGAVLAWAAYAGSDNNLIVAHTDAQHGTSNYGITVGGSYSSASSSRPGGVVNTPITLGSNSVTITNPSVTNPANGNQTGSYYGYYVYVIWGR